MEKKEASKLARQAIKLAGAYGKVRYTCRDSLSFDFIVDFYEYKDNDFSYEHARDIYKACQEVGLRQYSDPENDIMTDYSGCHNSMISYNGCSFNRFAE